jgi:hypothetical protein
VLELNIIGGTQSDQIFAGVATIIFGDNGYQSGDLPCQSGLAMLDIPGATFKICLPLAATM